MAKNKKAGEKDGKFWAKVLKKAFTLNEKDSKNPEKNYQLALYETIQEEEKNQEQLILGI